ncbi:MAG: type IV pilus secretin PilQ [Bdellovibrionaceae bacterium]|jgi:type IV pilus assembly protein PilQ|nr:type IV pilus secretin PilQ [Pseudobdellovibrionaceae bacterium]
MIRHLLAGLCLLGLAGAIVSCSSAPTKDDKEINQALNEEVGEEASADDNDFDEEEASEDLSEEEEFGGEEAESVAEEDLEEGEASDESLAENSEFTEDEPQDAVEPEIAKQPQEEAVSNLGGEGEVQVTKINFISDQMGGSILVEGSGDLKYQKRFNPQTNQFILELENTYLDDKLKRPLITKDFNSPIAAINAYQSQNSSVTRIVVQMSKPIEPTVQKNGNRILIIPREHVQQLVTANVAAQLPVLNSPKGPGANNFKKQNEKHALQAKTIEEFILGTSEYYGRRIDIHTGKDADIRDIIEFISEQSGANIVLSDKVTGTVNLKLRNIPWDQALIIILRSKRLGYIRQDNVLRISTLDDLEAENKAIQRVIQSRVQLSKLKVKVVPISYAEVEDLEKQVSKFSTPERGHVIADERTSSLIIKDTEEVIGNMVSLITKLDIPPPQVMIEAKIVEATQSFVDTFGISWGYSGASKKIGANSGTDVNLTSNFGFVSGTSGVGNFNLNIGQIDILGSLNAAIALEETKNTVKVISSPRIMALNNEEAEITQTGQVLTKRIEVTTDGRESVTVTPRTFAMTLKVTPQVTASGSVLLELDVARQFPGALDSGERPINGRTAKTKALVQNGQTAVIGGIFQNDYLKGENGIQGLKDIPFFGWLFKNKKLDRTKTELLIFVTPRVMPLDKSYANGVITDSSDLEFQDDIGKNSADEVESIESEIK